MSGQSKKDGSDVQKATAIAGNCKNCQVFRVLETVETVGVDDIEPQDLWNRFISQRKPVIIAGHPRDAEWKVHQRWSNEYLERRAGKVPVHVEYRDDESQSFGRGCKTTMSFAQLLKRLNGGDGLLYMSTQDPPMGPDDYPEVLAPPLTQLATDFPLRPRLMGLLVPQQINIWAGATGSGGSSSGLHHDYHDNLYVVIKGRKRFRLFPPSAVHAMYVNGRPVKIYDNGRIVYKGQRNVMADGSNQVDVNLWENKRRAEAQLEAAEKAFEREESDCDELLVRAEADLEEAMDDIAENWSKRKKKKEKKKPVGPEPEPESFSQVELSLPKEEMSRRFPLFPGLSAALECEVKAGEMLYLPAGWFHEVTSFNNENEIKDSVTGSRMHLALNYWFHPPDNLQPGDEGFIHPYTTEYWPELWEARECRYKAEIRALKEKEALIRGAHAHFLDGIRGMFGYGRRQHLYRFVKVHFKKRKKTSV